MLAVQHKGERAWIVTHFCPWTGFVAEALIVEPLLGVDIEESQVVEHDLPAYHQTSSYIQHALKTPHAEVT